MQVKEKFPGVFISGKTIFTKNNSPNYAVYGEELIKEGCVEYRSWTPFRSKLSAAIAKGLKTFPFKEDSIVLYLGAANGTTSSHVRDICHKGAVYCVEFSEESMRDLLKVAEKKSMVAIMGDARKPNEYQFLVPPVDIVYQDVAQPDQTRILLENCNMFLKPGGYAIIAIKARSVDTNADPRTIFKKVREELEKSFDIIEEICLGSFEKDHELLICRAK
jgi:fibrillarin-like pre-rRNA processing protein